MLGTHNIQKSAFPYSTALRVMLSLFMQRAESVGSELKC